MNTNFLNWIQARKMEIKLNIDTESLSKKLNQLQKKQLPFASAKAITDTLKNNVKPASLN